MQTQVIATRATSSLLPTVEEIKVAFPLATWVSVNSHMTCVGLTLGKSNFRITYEGGRFECRYDEGRGPSGFSATDWKQAVTHAIINARHRYEWKAGEASDKIAALDKAMSAQPDDDELLDDDVG